MPEARDVPSDCHGELSVVLVGVEFDVRVCRQASEKIVDGVVLRKRVDTASRKPDGQRVGCLPGGIQRRCGHSRGVILRAGARNVAAIGRDTLDAEADIPAVSAKVAVQPVIQRIVRAGLHVSINRRRGGAAARNDVNHPGERITAPDRALWAAHDFYPFDVGGRQEFPAKLVASGRIIRARAVYQNEHVIRFSTANAHLRLRAGNTGLADGKAWNLSKQVRHVTSLASLDRITLDDRYRTAQGADRERGA